MNKYTVNSKRNVAVCARVTVSKNKMNG